MSVKERIKELGIEILEIPYPVGAYRPSVRAGNLVFVSGQLPIKDGKLIYSGKVDLDISIEDGKKAARVAAINTVLILKNEVGDLEKIKRIVKVTGYVASSEGFIKQSDVINGASELYQQIFGDEGIHSRAAVGVYELPLGSPVEIEVIAEI